MAPASVGNGNLEDLERDVEALLRENQHQRRRSSAVGRERELNIFRSGSAPPTVEGSRNAISSIFGGPGIDRTNGYDAGLGMSEEEMRSHPAYLSYYYSNENLNPRLPPPSLSKEDWRVAQRFQVGASAFGRIGDRREEVVGDGVSGGSSSSLFSLQSGFHMRDVGAELAQRSIGSRRNSVRQPSAEWIEGGSGGLIGLPDLGVGLRKQSFTDELQEELEQSCSVSIRLPHPVSRNNYDKFDDPVRVTDVPQAQLQDSLKTLDNSKSRASSSSLVRVQNLESSASHSFASVSGSSLVRSTAADPQIVGKSSSPCLPTLGGGDDFMSNALSTCVTAQNDIVAAFSGLNLMNSRLLKEDDNVRGAALQEFADKTENLFSVSSNHNNYLRRDMIKPEVDSSNISSFPILSRKIEAADTNMSKWTSDGQMNLPNLATSASVYSKVPTGSAISKGFDSPQNPRITNVNFTGSHVNNVRLSQRLPTSTNSQINAGVADHHLSRNGDQTGPGIQTPLMDPLFSQQLQRNDSATNAVASFISPLGRNLVGSSEMDMSAYQKAYLKALLAQHKLQSDLPFSQKSSVFNDGYYGTSASALGMQYPLNAISASILPFLGSINPQRQDDRLSHLPSTMKSSAGVSIGSWNSECGAMEEVFASSLLEDFKSNKSGSFELLDIVGHVVEFSADQYGSRFIQQKLETASVEEKNIIFPEIFPHARALMTDVFGNYVIQKFFEHGSESQRKQLSCQLIGHVLPLSLQMYGCRVIQKALEVLNMDQQTQIVSELDGSVMRCVRDQNGNHVIQKCIECVPQEMIQFIISAFYEQVVPLSTHPYGCRVIQRVLEHCNDAKTQSIMMDEILLAVCKLAQDQYGNYVIQHVLQHGKQEERSAIINKLAGQIVKMSQQKFASNVVEKCLTYCTPEERQILIDEMLGSTDENEPLQAMMKDQFGNYVVQKALETCDDKNRELILSRIKAHVNSLKRYTYGKHIAARVEKVIAAGERRLAMSSYTP